MKIYVADLAEYNRGILKGEWFDLEDYTDEDELMEDITEMLEDNEEWQIHDVETEYIKSSWIDENESLENLIALQECITEHEEIKIAAIMECMSTDIDDVIEYAEDADFYEDMDFTELAEQFVDEGLFGEIPESFANYIDFEAIGRDLSYDYTETEYGIIRTV